METTYAGQGDPRRTMQLLWGLPSSIGETAARGPRPGLSIEAIVTAAVQVADADGLAAVSMRAVGERLGRTAMALYTYVPSKAELVDLMLDRVLLEQDVDYDVASGWRLAAQAWALGLWAFYLRHPWVHHISTARPLLGPGSYVSLERPVAIFTSVGLGGGEAVQVVGTVSAYVAGVSRQVSELREAARTLGQSEDEWWNTQSRLVEELVPDIARRYPHLTAAEQDGAFDLDAPPGGYLEQEARASFAFGLERLLDGISVYLEQRQPQLHRGPRSTGPAGGKRRHTGAAGG